MARLLLLGDAAELVGVRLWKLQRLVKDGRVPEAVAVGRYWAIPEDKVAAIRERLASTGLVKLKAVPSVA